MILGLFRRRAAHAEAVQWRSIGRTHRGCVRERNEDALFECSASRVWAVADGMGGHASGEVASAAVVRAVERACNNANDGALRCELDRANKELLQLAAADPEADVIGATVAILKITSDRYDCIWAGDSRVYLLRRGRLAQLTRDHTLVQEMVDAGSLTPAAALTDRRSHVVTRAVGAGSTLSLEESSGRLAADDRFLLCTDGLVAVLNDDDLQEILRRRDIASAANELLRTALFRGAPDNVSFVIASAG